MKFGIIGCGNLGSSLIKGFLGAKVLKAGEILGSDVNGERLEQLRKLGIQTVKDNGELVRLCDVVFIAVKPDVVESVLKETEEVSEGKLFVSVAAGVSIGFIEARTKARVIRVMPNICGAVGEMASCFSKGEKATRKDGELVNKLLGGIGMTFETEEKLMDVITALSGSGPAYFALVIGALAQAGVEKGLQLEVAMKLAAQTAKGASELLLKSGKTPAELVEMTRTPRGTTAEGMRVLEERGVVEAMKGAVRAATKRSKELSR